MTDEEIARVVAEIDALQDGWTSGEDEQRLVEILAGVHGEDLTRLKNALNMRRDDHDLEGLVFSGIDDENRRQQVLDHVDREARKVHPGKAKVLCDIDDTVFCALHDERYPRSHSRPYPGILALLEALDEGPDDQPFSQADLAFVTARPGDVLGLIQGSTRSALTGAGITSTHVMTGRLWALRSKDAMAARKLANIDSYAHLFPEYPLVFIGDSGQGDVTVATKGRSEHGERMPIAIIHDVVETAPRTRESLREKGIHLVDTYVGAALAARQAGLISARGLQRVLAETQEGMAEVPWESPEQERRMRELLERDAAAAESAAHPG